MPVVPMKRKYDYVRMHGGTKRVRRTLFRSRSSLPKTLSTRSKRIGRLRPRTKWARRVMNVMNNYAERKIQYTEIADNFTLTHNEVQSLNTNALYTQRGPYSEINGQSVANYQGNRIGKKIYVKGMSIRGIIESQQYRPNVDYWLYLVRNVNDEGAINSNTKMFEGLTDQLPTDYVDNEKVQVLYCKKMKPRMPNPGADNAMNTTGTGGISDGNAHPADIVGSVPNPKTVFKDYIRLNRYVTYKDNSTDPVAYFKYQWVIVSYNNNSTINNGGTWPCGHLWLNTKMYFTDV
jgi:hypothetical protein